MIYQINPLQLRTSLSKALLVFLPTICFLSPIAAQAESWFGLEGGIAAHTRTDFKDNKPEANTNNNQLPGANLAMTGITMGVRTSKHAVKPRFGFYFLTSPKANTSGGVQEFTGHASQTIVGFEPGFNITDYFYIGVNILPWSGLSYASGTKIRTLPGRTSDLGRTWDATISFFTGFDLPLSKTITIGGVYREIGTAAGFYGPDSGGHSVNTHYFGISLLAWFHRAH